MSCGVISIQLAHFTMIWPQTVCRNWLSFASRIPPAPSRADQRRSARYRQRSSVRCVFLDVESARGKDNRSPPECDREKSSAQFQPDRKSTRLNSSHLVISYAVFCLKKK